MWRSTTSSACTWYDTIEHLPVRLQCRPHLKLGTLLQVFEYLSTDLKKFMDRTGKGNANPMPPKLIKVTSSFAVH